MTESIDQLTKLLVSPPGEGSWIPLPDPQNADNREILTRMKELGFGGVVTNVAYENYLRSEESWECFLEGVRICRELGLRVWIYDEVGYPSGGANGITLEGHPELEAEALTRSECQVAVGAVEIRPPSAWKYAVKAVCICDGKSTDITDQIGQDGWIRLTAESPCTIERYDVRIAFDGSHATQNFFELRRYINVLNPDAVGRFYDVTYQAYIDRLGDDLDMVEAFFTDEPSFMSPYITEIPDSVLPYILVKDAPNKQFDRLPQLPWRENLHLDFERKWGYDLLPRLGSLYAGSSIEDKRIRHDFNQLVSEIYADSFMGLLQSRLDEHGIDLTGHLLAEEHLIQHAATQGYLIEHLKRERRPGIDILNGIPDKILDSTSLLTCKYGSSAGHLRGQFDVMCEASDWVQRSEGIKTTIEQRRGALAVQMVLGITTFASYFIWSGYEPQEIRGLMDFLARVHAAITSGTHVAPVAVLYPIRTAWVEYVPITEPINGDEMPKTLDWLDDALFDIAKKLLGSQIDFDFIDSESLVATNGQLKAADETYDILIVPPGTVLSADDIDAVKRLAGAGTRILAFAPSEVQLSDETPQEVFAELSKRYPETVLVTPLSALGRGVGGEVSGDNWLECVEAGIERGLDISGETESLLVRRNRIADGNIYLLVNPTPKPISLKVESDCSQGELWNPSDGSVQPLQSEIKIEANSARIVMLPN